MWLPPDRGGSSAVRIERGAGTSAAERPFQFGLISDMPYSHAEEQEFLNVIAKLNAKELAFVVHVGDMQNDPRPHNQNPARSMQPCSDEVNNWLVARFQTIPIRS